MHHFAHISSRNDAVAIDAVLDVLSILGQLLTTMQELIHKGWQARSIGNLIRELVMWDNRWEIRRKGVELMLAFCDVLRGSCDNTVLAVFGSLVNYVPFCTERNKLLKAFFVTKTLCAKSENFKSENFFANQSETPPVARQMDESLQVLQMILYKATSKHHDQESFDFWFTLLEERIFPHL